MIKILNNSVKFSTLVLICLFLISCEEKGKEAKEPKKRRTPSENIPSEDLGECKSSKVLDISKNGKMITSQFSTKSRRSGIMSWDLRTKEIVNQHRVNLKFKRTSPNGEYFLRELSSRKYQLLSFSNTRGLYNTVIPINSITEPEFDFSQDSKYLLINTRPYNSNGMNQFDIFDIEKQRYFRSFRARGIKFFKMTKDNKHFVIGYDNGQDKFIAMYTLDRDLREVYKIELPRYGNFSFLESAMNRIIIKSDRTYFAFDTNSGKKVYQGSYKHFYNVSHSGKFALIAIGFGEVAVLNTRNGDLTYTKSIPSQTDISSCRLTDSPLQLICIDKINLGKVFVFDIKSEESTSVCI